MHLSNITTTPANMELTLGEVLGALSTALDVVDGSLNHHHQVVAYISFRLLGALGLVDQNARDVVLAALIHDIGLIRHFHQSGTSIVQRELDLDHPFVGSKYVKQAPVLASLSDLILYHHFGEANLATLRLRGIVVPENVDILHAADSIAVVIKSEGGPEHPEIRERTLQYVNKVGEVEFSPRVRQRIGLLLESDAFWLDMQTERMAYVLRTLDSAGKVTSQQALQIAQLFSLIIDGRSKFTANHSFGVAFLAQELALFKGWSPADAQRMSIAGNLHDVGKLAVANEILEKPGKLDEKEWRIMRTHTFHTRRVLEQVSGLGEVVDWAADHHERLDGKGYPYGKQSDQISPGARIVAVADVMTALTETRPYRKQLGKDEVLSILRKMVDGGGLDRDVVTCAGDNFERLNAKREQAQSEHEISSNRFWREIGNDLHVMASKFLAAPPA